jgi:magnesium chelatase subunit D
MMGEVQRGGSWVDPAHRFPFSAVVGQDEARLALLLGAIDPALGGVLLRGEKGSGRTTLAQGLTGLLPGGARFVELPPGATEEQLVGTLEFTSPLTGGEAQLRPGLLAAAHGGVLYVPEVNRAPEHLLHLLFDAAVSSVNRVERDGASREHPARFVLVGAMDPAEGELRPHLLDRFGLSVETKAPLDPATRAEVVRRRLMHDSGAAVEGHEPDIVLRARLAAALPADMPASVVDFACHLAVSAGAEGLRADLVLCRAAAAYAGWEGRSITTTADVEQVAGLVLGHRHRRRPFDPPTLNLAVLERALASTRQAFAAPGREAEAAGEEAPTQAAGTSPAGAAGRAPPAAAGTSPAGPPSDKPAAEPAERPPAPPIAAETQPARPGEAPSPGTSEAGADEPASDEAVGDQAAGRRGDDSPTPDRSPPDGGPEVAPRDADTGAPGAAEGEAAAAGGTDEDSSKRA